MRLISTRNCQAGMVLAKTIFNDRGQVLLSEGVTLTDPVIARIQELGINFVYIFDERLSDIEPTPILSDRTRTKAVHMIKSLFDEMEANGHHIHAVSSPRFGKALRSLIRDILRDIRSHRQVLSLLTDVMIHDRYTFQHSLNVTIYTLAVALKLGYNEAQLEEIGIGAMLHDIGKVAVPLEILNKKGKLTDEEYHLIKEHTTYGFELLRKVEELPLLAAHCAYQHHERLDGSGYPRKLKGDAIHPYAKLLGITDVFDALTSQRSYRKAMLPHQALEVIYSGAGIIFDFDLVQAFKDTISMYPIGITVRLSNGYMGVVIDHNRNLPSRPIVRLFRDPNGKEIDTLEEIDLSKHLSIVIEDCELYF